MATNKTPKQTPKKTTKLEFTLGVVKTKPPRRYRKGSKYDPILDTFIKDKEKLVKLVVKGKDANYMRTQLNNRIKAREIKGITVSVINSIIYLEKK